LGLQFGEPGSETWDGPFYRSYHILSHVLSNLNGQSRLTKGEYQSLTDTTGLLKGIEVEFFNPTANSLTRMAFPDLGVTISDLPELWYADSLTGQIAKQTLDNYQSVSHQLNKFPLLYTGFYQSAGATRTPFAELLAPRTNPRMEKQRHFKNLIMNGNFDIWQRGSSFLGVGGAQYTADRWYFYNNPTCTAVYNVALENNPPTPSQSGVHSKNCFQTDVATVQNNASLASTPDSLCFISQRIEGHLSRVLLGQELTLSFWVRSGVPGTYSVSFLNHDGTRSYLAEYSIQAANSWEKKSITLRFDDQVSSWLPSPGVVGLRVNWALVIGSNWQGAKDSWSGAQVYGTANQVNQAGTLNNFALSQVQLEVGSIPTGFEFRNEQEELVLCQRYMEKVAAMTHINGFDGTVCYADVRFQVPKANTALSVMQSGTETITWFSVGSIQLSNPSLSHITLYSAMLFFDATSAVPSASYYYMIEENIWILGDF